MDIFLMISASESAERLGRYVFVCPETWEFLETELLPLVSVNGAPRRPSSERAALSPTPSRECGASGARDPTHTHSHLVTYTLSTHQSQLPGFGITVLHEDAGSIPGETTFDLLFRFTFR